MTTKKIRVAIIVPGGLGTGRSNIGVPVLERQVQMLAKEFDVVVFSLFPVNLDYQPKGFQIISVPGRRTLFKALSLLVIFRRLNKIGRFDVVHGFWILPAGFFAVTLGKYFSIPAVVSVLGGDAVALPEINYGQLRRVVPRLLARWTMARTRVATALTQFLVTNLESHGIRRQDIRILPWGISNDQFPFKPHPVAQPVSFLHIANFNAVKDQLTLLKAFKVIAMKIDCHLTMVGEGPLESDLKDWIAGNGLSNRVTIMPPVDYEDVGKFYPHAMILLHTSLSEGQSEVVTEAMSSGVVVCGTQVGLMFDLPSCCVGVKVGDHQMLAEEVLKLISDGERVAAIRGNARNWTHTHNIDWTVNATATIYREACQKKRD